MNPYDFVPLDTEHPPERRKPVWHNVLTPKDASSRLYSGYLYLYIQAETPLFIHDTRSSMQDPNNPGQHLRNQWDEYIIPGTSLKGLLRNTVETLCRGCMTVFRTPQEYTHNPLPDDFAPCQQNTKLCISCRLFGMMQARQSNAEVFLGKLNIEDARAYESEPNIHKPIYTAVLDSPKPRHRAFYLDAQGNSIAGRKFYFHNQQLLTEQRLIPIPNRDMYRNQYIQPLASGTDFSSRIDFTNLEADEFAALLFAILLQQDMRHKIGYGKPIGLGSVQLAITALKLVDYSKRYSTLHSADRGMTYYEGDALTDLLNQQMAPLDGQVKAAWQRFSALPSLQHLHSIWRWPPDTSVEYAYPSQRWFRANPNARIPATRNLYRGD